MQKPPKLPLFSRGLKNLVNTPMCKTCMSPPPLDAAEVPGGFRAGVVGGPSCYRSCICPPWITSVQQAEAFAGFWAVQIAVYKGARAVAVGVDSDAARAQLSSLSASTACKGY